MSLAIAFFTEQEMLRDCNHFRVANVFNDRHCKSFRVKKPIVFMPAGVLRVEGGKTHEKAYGSSFHASKAVKKNLTALFLTEEAHEVS